MSPVNEAEVIEEPDPRFAKVAIKSRALIGASDRMPVRVIVLVIALGICVTLAPLPANIIGIGALLLLALDIALHRR